MYANPAFLSDRRFTEGVNYIPPADLLASLLTVDGAGSGLDADLLDGQHGAYYTGYTDTAISNHLAAPDPHSQYLTQTEGDALYSPIAHSHRLDQITNPNADTTFNMVNNHLKFTWVAPVTGGGIDGALEIEATGNFSGDLLHIHQHTGNPSAATDLIHIEASSANAIPLRVLGNGIAGIFESGNVLFGTATDSANGKIQLVSSTAITGGIGFGTDVSLYRSAAATLRTNAEVILDKRLALGPAIAANVMLHINQNLITSAAAYGFAVNSACKVNSSNTGTFANFLAFAGAEATTNITNYIGFYATPAPFDAGSVIQNITAFWAGSYTAGITRNASFNSNQSLAPTVSITSLTQTGGVATAVAAGHGFSTGDIIYITGATPTGYLGQIPITVVDPDTFTYSVLSGLASPATGTILARRYNCFSFYQTTIAPFYTAAPMFVGRTVNSYAYNNSVATTEFGGNQVNIAAAPAVAVVGSGTAAGNYPLLLLARSRWTYSATQRMVHSPILSGDTIAHIRFSGDDGTQIVNNGGALLMVASDGDWSTSSKPAYFQIYTTPAGTSTSVVRMRFNSSGEVGIGTAAPTGYKLYVYNADDLTVSGNTPVGIYSNVVSNPVGQSHSGAVYGIQTFVSANYGATFSLQSAVGVSSKIIVSGAGNITAARSFLAEIPRQDSTGVILNYYCFQALDSSVAQATFGFKSEIQAATAKWNLYVNGTALNYLKGALLIDTLTDDTINKLQVTGGVKITGNFEATGTTTISGYPPNARSITGTLSISGGGDLSANRTLSLVNDSATPGNSKYYGTDGAGVKGFFTLPSGSLSDGDKGDITVSAGGATWTIDALAVTDSKINDVAWSKITGEPTTLAGYGISDTKANFNSACSDGDFLFVGDVTAYTNEEAQDAVGTILVDTDTIDFTYTDATPSITAAVKMQMSVTSDASGVKLSGDAASPGNSMLYGTNGSGTKGWYAQPGGAAPTGILSDLQFSLLQSDGTLNAASGVQTWAGTNKTAQDVFTVAANTTYRIRGQWLVNTGATTHTTAMAFAVSGATITDFQYLVTLWSAAANTIATAQSTTHVTGVASKVLNATSTAVYTLIQFEGILVIGANGGTITPQINFSANPTGTNLMKRGSWVSFEKLGTDTVTQAGGWA